MTPIYVASVQHTGTWFVLEFLRNHPQVNYEVVEWKDIRDGMVPTLDPKKKTLVHSHIRSQIHDLIPETFMRAYGAVVPLRDPLRAMITRHTRHPDLDHRYIVDGFLWLIRRYYSSEPGEMCFLPIDADIHRERALNQVLDFCRLQPNNRYVKEYAEAWTPRNVSKPSALKEAYYVGDMDAIRKAIPNEVRYLQENADEIARFLSMFGYTSFMW